MALAVPLPGGQPGEGIRVERLSFLSPWWEPTEGEKDPFVVLDWERIRDDFRRPNSCFHNSFDARLQALGAVFRESDGKGWSALHGWDFSAVRRPDRAWCESGWNRYSRKGYLHFQVAWDLADGILCIRSGGPDPRHQYDGGTVRLWPLQWGSFARTRDVTCPACAPAADDPAARMGTDYPRPLIWVGGDSWRCTRPGCGTVYTSQFVRERLTSSDEREIGFLLGA